MLSFVKDGKGVHLSLPGFPSFWEQCCRKGSVAFTGQYPDVASHLCSRLPLPGLPLSPLPAAPSCVPPKSAVWGLGIPWKQVGAMGGLQGAGGKGPLCLLVQHWISPIILRLALSIDICTLKNWGKIFTIFSFLLRWICFFFFMKHSIFQKMASENHLKVGKQYCDCT